MKVRKERSNKGKKRGPYKKQTLKLVAKYKSNNNSPIVKKRKQRSNKGKKRGPRKLKLVSNYKSNNNSPTVKKRKQRSNKGKKRGPYKKKTIKHNIPKVVVTDYNNTQREKQENKEWKEVENILFNINSNNNKPLVKRKNKNKNNRPLARTRSGRAFRK